MVERTEGLLDHFSKLQVNEGVGESEVMSTGEMEEGGFNK